MTSIFYVRDQTFDTREKMIIKFLYIHSNTVISDFFIKIIYLFKVTIMHLLSKDFIKVQISCRICFNVDRLNISCRSLIQEMFLIDILLSSFLFRLVSHVDDSGHWILQENTGNRRNTEAVFRPEIDRIFFGGFLPTSLCFPTGTGRKSSQKDSEKLLVGILLPQNH